MKSAAVIAKPKDELKQIVPQVVHWLRIHDYEVLVDPVSAEHAPGFPVVEREEIAARKPSFVIVLGGDGTMLAAARAVAKAQIPIVGVNLGSLGFLTEIPLTALYPTLEALDANRCEVEKRAMLKCDVQRNGGVVESYEALNDAVINKNQIARLADFDLFIDGGFVSNYKADGVIIATPTGSTAYSLAAGGPILMPNVESFVITPVSPHSLTNRPLVVKDTARIEVEVKNAEEDAYLSIDGQVGRPLKDGDRIVCRKSEHYVDLIRLEKTSVFDILRTKLKWGQR